MTRLRGSEDQRLPPGVAESWCCVPQPPRLPTPRAAMPGAEASIAGSRSGYHAAWPRPAHVTVAAWLPAEVLCRNIRRARDHPYARGHSARVTLLT